MRNRWMTFAAVIAIGCALAVPALALPTNRTVQEALNALSIYMIDGRTKTATGNTSAFEVAEKSELVVTLDVTAASGTSPTLDVKLQHSPDGSVWDDLGAAFTQATGVTTETKAFTQFHRYVRAAYTIGGTSPSFTFSVLATAK